jgi:FkbM family methyltransferase
MGTPHPFWLDPFERYCGLRGRMKPLKRQLQRILGNTAIYHRLKASSLHELYWKITDQKWIESRDKEVEFYRSLLSGLREGDVIFDIGAHEGFKTDVFLRLGARIVAMEPDEANQSILRAKFLKLRIAPKPVVVVGKAVSDKNTTVTMWIDGDGSAVNTLSQKWADTLKQDKARHKYGHCGLDFAKQKSVQTTTLEDLINQYGSPLFVKIDVEGHELSVIRGLGRPVPYLSFELNLPEFKAEGLECVELLRKLDANGKFNYAVDCERGLALDQWLSTDGFRQVLEGCTQGCLEVFWRSSSAGSGARPNGDQVAVRNRR